MALKPKHPHICVDEKIWDDPVMIKLSPSAFRVYIFAIAWSKCQGSRTPDGLLTEHGITRIGATPSDVKELADAKLLEKCEAGYNIQKWEEWQVTAAEAAMVREIMEQERIDEERRLNEIDAQKERQREYGTQGAKKRWKIAEPPVPEEGFDPEAKFIEAWTEWPEPTEPKFRERREEAFDSFRANIVNSKDFNAFAAALMKRLKDYHADNRPKSERRKYLGAFKNFCDGRWKDYIPKNYRADGSVPVPLVVAEPELPAEVPFAPKPVPFTKFPPRNEIVGGVSDADLVALLETQNPAA